MKKIELKNTIYDGSEKDVEKEKRVCNKRVESGWHNNSVNLFGRTLYPSIIPGGADHLPG